MLDDFVYLEELKTALNMNEVNVIQLDAPFTGYITIEMKNKTVLTMKDKDADNFKKNIMKIVPA